MLATLAAPVDPELERLLGAAGAAALRQQLAARARRWAAAVAPDRAFEATSTLMAAAALAGHDGPLLLVAGDVPGLTAGHAAAAVADLGAGSDIVFAPTNDGSPFLVGLPCVDSGLLDRLDEGFAALAQAAGDRGGGIGMLGSERRLVTATDAAALAADPTAPEELVRHLRGVLPVRRAPG